MVPDDRIMQKCVFNVSATAWSMFFLELYLVANELYSMGRRSE